MGEEWPRVEEPGDAPSLDRHRPTNKTDSDEVLYYLQALQNKQTAAKADLRSGRLQPDFKEAGCLLISRQPE